ncbi:neutral zinc metallopeptidase [Nocardioides sp. Y6]|uniref:Neutral zinc metallopeptidase n=1 Tax=Nocardioides malaquae TaxID=2773426 RepID=A0ABR9RS60_9ACTN|nr:neutral zinc metallopeptidase [Nocardioides malaquae]MBE7324396.1 neutral zinc metallopeptidase [Nocardioides malaquae]
MRFNPRARLDTGRVADRGRSGGLGGGGRGGLPIPGGVAAGGGFGTLLIVLLVVLVSCLGNDGGGGGLGAPGGMIDQGAGADTSRMTDSGRYDHCETGEDANEDVDCARVAVENSLFQYWSDVFTRGGARFRPASMTTFTGGVGTGCGQASSQVGPFYCPADQGIYLDDSFFSDVLEKQLGGNGGDFVEPYVLAHEYGHHVQNLLGTMGKVRTQQGPQSDAVRLELQADCYAGMWTRAAEGTSDVEGVAIFAELDRGDIEEALDSAKAVGDDRIQQRSGGRVDSDGWTHGSSEQRMRWFMTGYERGDLGACDTFAANQL